MREERYWAGRAKRRTAPERAKRGSRVVISVRGSQGIAVVAFVILSVLGAILPGDVTVDWLELMFYLEELQRQMGHGA